MQFYQWTASIPGLTTIYSFVLSGEMQENKLAGTGTAAKDATVIQTWRLGGVASFVAEIPNLRRTRCVVDPCWQ